MSVSDDTTDAVAIASFQPVIGRAAIIARLRQYAKNSTEYRAAVALDAQAQRLDYLESKLKAGRGVCDLLLQEVDNLKAMCVSYADTIGKCNAENADLEAKVAAVTRERDGMLRAVKTLRAFPIDPPRDFDESCKTDPCGYCDGYRDGVEAVQALLGDER